ncbi:bifunctional DNA primase/polymerase [Nocardiopsis suaedae]|uniref:Bifunctional DNA primase/polymerase n=1 Tax=Nocardiopsis suaedae TaxID=3018444 RepID=A0ABT4TNA8_9ACTN|nr:bifunctional DNA primase/polymerase [Nocardiopsis suaedae]MDA2805729.1 bifunctional DNA primase/polymerase [Nocardiopsis suaedae]
MIPENPASRRDYAITYIDNGEKVFVLGPGKAPLANCRPCREGHRTPEEMEACTCLTCHGLYAATDDMDRVDAMLAQNPDGLLAIRTGAVSDLVVIDVDPPEGLETMAQMMEAGILRETRAQRTGSGGWHLCYRHPGGYVPSGAGRAGHKVDVKADGGYIVAAPSAHPRTGQPYTWRFDFPTAPRDEVHPGLLKIIRPPEQPRPEADPRDFDHISHRRLRGLVDTVLDSQEGGRNAALHWAACKAGEMVARGEITEQVAYDALAAAAQHTGLPLREIGTGPHNGTIGSGLRKGGR